MKRKDLFMATTDVSVVKTIGQISEYLVRMGANQIMQEFDRGEAVGLYFTIAVKGQVIPFRLPARVDPVFNILHAGRQHRSREVDFDQAKRVAWRQIYRWIQAQLAMIETGMVTAEEVLMPYIQVGPNETLYQRAVSGGFQKLLASSNGIPPT